MCFPLCAIASPAISINLYTHFSHLYTTVTAPRPHLLLLEYNVTLFVCWSARSQFLQPQNEIKLNRTHTIFGHTFTPKSMRAYALRFWVNLPAIAQRTNTRQKSNKKTETKFVNKHSRHTQQSATRARCRLRAAQSARSERTIWLPLTSSAHLALRGYIYIFYYSRLPFAPKIDDDKRL